jgi:hypothetical protein
VLGRENSAVDHIIINVIVMAATVGPFDAPGIALVPYSCVFLVLIVPIL